MSLYGRVTRVLAFHLLSVNYFRVPFAFSVLGRRAVDRSRRPIPHRELITAHPTRRDTAARKLKPKVRLSKYTRMQALAQPNGYCEKLV